MDALAADFCPPKKTIVDTIAAAPSRLARFCFSFSLSSEDDSDEDATIEKHVSFVLFLFDDDVHYLFRDYYKGRTALLPHRLLLQCLE